MFELKETLIPIVAIICSIGLPLSIPIIYLVLNYHKRRRLIELVHAERLAAIERGMEIPTLPIEILGAPPVGRSALLSGLIWLLVGLALMAALHGLDGHSGFGGSYVWGLVPTAVGVAYLIYYFVEGRRRGQPPTERP
jgi:hypothetical protein